MAHLMVTGEKKRAISLVIYAPDDAIDWTEKGYAVTDNDKVTERYERLLAFCDSLRIQCCVSPLHYADRYDEDGVKRWYKNHMGEDGKLSAEDEKIKPCVGMVKKPHWHVFVYSKGGRYLGGMKKMWSSWGVTKFWVEDDKDVAIRYQAHLDSPQKAQYDASQVVAFGGLDISALYKLNAQDKISVVESICTYIKQQECTNFYDLVNGIITFEDMALFESLISRQGFYSAYMGGLSEKLERQRKVRKDTQGG